MDESNVMPLYCVMRQRNGFFFVQATNQVISYCPEATEEEKLAAVAAAEKAFETWQDSSILTRQQIMFGLQQKIKDNMVTSFI